MPVSSKKIDFTGGKIQETPAGGVVSTITTVTDSLVSAKECVHGQFKLDPSATDIAVAMGNISTAKIAAILTDGPVSVKINGGVNAIVVDQTFLLFGELTSLSISNPHLTEIRTVETYFATDET